MSTPTHALVVDLETTDNDPYAPHSAILELGAILCRWEPELPEVARASLLIRPPGAQPDHDLMWSRMPQVVRDMHTANGLWREATSSGQAWDLTQADRAITSWVTEHIGTDARVPVTGSGVGHLDHPFIKAKLPQLAQRLTYWPLDIGNVRRLLALAGRDDLVDLPTDVDAKPHRGLGDAELHLAETRRYLQLLGRIPGAGADPTEHTDEGLPLRGGVTL